MGGYFKVWTDIGDDDWFVGLKLIERGLWYELLRLAKSRGDSGGFSLRSNQHLATEVGGDRSTVARICAKFHASLKIIVRNSENGGIYIEIPKYRYWQNLTSEDYKIKSAKNRGKVVGFHDLQRQREYTETERERESIVNVNKVDFSSVVKSWNDFASELGLEQIKTITVKRQKGVKARLVQSGFDATLVYSRIRESNFLQGVNDRGWQVNFDFVWCSPENWVKILEGRYANKQRGDDLAAWGKEQEHA